MTQSCINIRTIVGGFASFLVFNECLFEKCKRIRNAGYPCRSNDHPWPEIRWSFSPAGGISSVRRFDTSGVPDSDLDILWWGLFNLASVHYKRGPSVVTATSAESHCMLRFPFGRLYRLRWRTLQLLLL